MIHIDPETGKVTDPVRDLIGGNEPTNTPRQVSESKVPTSPIINDYVRVVPTNDGLKIQVNTGERWLIVASRNEQTEADRVALAIKNMALVYSRACARFVTEPAR